MGAEAYLISPFCLSILREERKQQGHTFEEILVSEGKVYQLSREPSYSGKEGCLHWVKRGTGWWFSRGPSSLAVRGTPSTLSPR